MFLFKPFKTRESQDLVCGIDSFSEKGDDWESTNPLVLRIEYLAIHISSIFSEWSTIWNTRQRKNAEKEEEWN